MRRRSRMRHHCSLSATILAQPISRRRWTRESARIDARTGEGRSHGPDAFGFVGPRRFGLGRVVPRFHECLEATMSDSYPVTKRNKVVRRYQRGSYDKATVHAILDAALL